MSRSATVSVCRARRHWSPATGACCQAPPAARRSRAGSRSTASAEGPVSSQRVPADDCRRDDPRGDRPTASRRSGALAAPPPVRRRADGYACKAPEGAMCTSVSGVHANSAAHLEAGCPSRRHPPATLAIYGASIAPGAPRARHRLDSLHATRTAPVGRPRGCRWRPARGILVHMVVDTRPLADRARSPCPAPRIGGGLHPTTLLRRPPRSRPRRPRSRRRRHRHASRCPRRFTPGSDAMPQERNRASPP